MATITNKQAETLLKTSKIEVVVTNLQDVRIGRKKVTLEFPNCRCKNMRIKHVPENSNTFRIETTCCKDMGWLHGDVYHFKLEDVKNHSTRFTDNTSVPEYLQSMKLTKSLARRLNRKWCKRFNLKRLRVVIWPWAKVKRMLEKKKFELFGFEQPASIGKNVEGMHASTLGKICIIKEVDPKRHWAVFIHEVAHYREKRHGEDFREETVAVGKWFEMQLKKEAKKLPELQGVL